MGGRVDSTMKTSPAVKCMKIILTVFNFVFLVTGITILALGIWTKVQLHVYLEMSGVYNSAAGWAMIGVGAGIVLISIMGCCCTVKGVSFLLYLYSAILILVFIGDLGVSISAFVFKSKIEDGFKTGLPKAMNEYSTNPQQKEAVDDLQSSLDCCGNATYTDWYTISWDGQSKSDHVPDSCYGDVNNKNATLHRDGCYTKVSDFLKKNFLMIGGVSIAFSFVMLFGALLACCLGKNINKAKYEQVA